jgi:hypothetical protein
MAAIYSNGGNRWNILGFNFTKRDELSNVYKISMLSSTLIHVSLGLNYAYVMVVFLVPVFHVQNYIVHLQVGSHQDDCRETSIV